MPIQAGANAIAITPSTTQFLAGYPHVDRYSTGVDTELYSSALYLDDGTESCLLIGNDLIYLGKAYIQAVRDDIAARTGLAANRIMVTCTHSHSAPVTYGKMPYGDDASRPGPDEKYMAWLHDRIVTGAVAAVGAARTAEIGYGFGDSSQVGGNRRYPKGKSNPRVPVVFVRDAHTHAPLALMMVTCVHPTVLHEDSTLVGGDFPGHARQHLQQALGNIPIVYHTGTSGNQSPRHWTRENTVAEAGRLGGLLAASVREAVTDLSFTDNVSLHVDRVEVDLPLNTFPPVAEAEKREREAFVRFDRMRRERADPRATRTAECDWFGAERRLSLARAFASGKLERIVRETVLPAEIQAVRVGPWTFVAWPGEVFVEFGLAVNAARPDAFVIAYANGTTQGYLVTAEAVQEGGYEAANAALKSPESPQILVDKTLEILSRDGFQHPP